MTDSTGSFSIRAPRAGAYRVGFGINGWGDFYGDTVRGVTDEVKRGEYLASFKSVVVGGGVPDSIFEHAEPATMRSQVSNQAVPVGGFTLGGSLGHPILGVVIGTVAPRTVFVQYAVDSAGRVDPRSLVIPPTTSANDKLSLKYLLPRIGYKPAHIRGVPTCEMVRLQVNFQPQTAR